MAVMLLLCPGNAQTLKVNQGFVCTYMNACIGYVNSYNRDATSHVGLASAVPWPAAHQGSSPPHRWRNIWFNANGAQQGQPVASQDTIDGECACPLT